MGHIFISYSHKDKDYVHKLQEALQKEGFDVWIDDRIDYGTEWPKVIQYRLDECEAFIVVISENAFKSKWVQNEVTRADRKGKPIFPLLLDGDPWLSVEATQYVDVTDGSLPSKKFFERLSNYKSEHISNKLVVKTSPPSTFNKGDLLADADDAYYAGEYEQAAQLYKQVLEKQPGNIRAKEQLVKAELTLMASKPDSDLPRAAIQYFRRARSHIAARDFVAATNLLNAALEAARAKGMEFPEAENLLNGLQNLWTADEYKAKGEIELKNEQWGSSMGFL